MLRVLAIYSMTYIVFFFLTDNPTKIRGVTYYL
jgi:hypothetical protein